MFFSIPMRQGGTLSKQRVQAGVILHSVFKEENKRNFIL